MSDRLSDEQVAWHVKYHNADWARHNLACEVLASRKLIADLRALPYDYITVNLLQQMIGKAGL